MAYANYRDVALIAGRQAAKQALRDALTLAETTPVYAAVFGDSQETVISGAGVELNWLNSYACAQYGQSPASQLMPTTGTGWCAATLLAGDSVVGFEFTLTSATTTTITYSSLSATDDLYNGWWVQVYISNVAHERQVTDYNGTTKVLTLASALPSTPSGFVSLSPMKLSKVPPGYLGAIQASAGLGCIAGCRPDNSNAGSGGKGYFGIDPNVQMMKLPDAIASLATTDQYLSRWVFAKRPTPHLVSYISCPDDIPPSVDYFASTVDSGTLATAADLTGTSDQFLVRTAPAKFDADKPYPQVRAYDGVNNPLVAAPIIGVRFENPNGKGLLFDFFSHGGYSCTDLVRNHAEMGDFFAVMPQYKIAIIALSVNDAYSYGYTPAQFKVELLAAVALVRTELDPDVIVIWGDTPPVFSNDTIDGYYAEYPDVAREIAEDASDVVSINTRRALEQLNISQLTMEIGRSTLPWSSGTAYAVGDTAWNLAEAVAGTASDQKLYICNAINTNEKPPNVSYWDDATWVTAASYVVGDIVGYFGVAYYCVVAHSSSGSLIPATSPHLWLRLPEALYDTIHLSHEGSKDRAACQWALMMAVGGETGSGAGASVAEIIEGIKADAELGTGASGMVTRVTAAAVQSTTAAAEVVKIPRKASAITAGAAATETRTTVTDTENQLVETRVIS